jgi:hypothetical protein
MLLFIPCGHWRTVLGVAVTGCGTIRIVDSDDPERRIRELERRLADAKGGPRENVPAGDEAGSAEVAGMTLPPSPGMMAPAPPGVNPPSYDPLRRQMDRRRRLGSIWLVFLVPGIMLVGILVFHPYRVEKHSTPSTSWSGGEPTPDLSGAVTVGPGGNLTAEPSNGTVTFVCDRGDVTIGGNTNSFYLVGHCAHLTVRGSHNKVIVDGADAIDTDGSGNQVIYHSGTPQISVAGAGNIVEKG